MRRGDRPLRAPLQRCCGPTRLRCRFIAIHARPAITITAHSPGSHRHHAVNTVTTAKTMVARPVRLSRLSRRVSRGSSAAPAVAPSPIQPVEARDHHAASQIDDPGRLAAVRHGVRVRADGDEALILHGNGRCRRARSIQRRDPSVDENHVCAGRRRRRPRAHGTPAERDGRACLRGPGDESSSADQPSHESGTPRRLGARSALTCAPPA